MAQHFSTICAGCFSKISCFPVWGPRNRLWCEPRAAAAGRARLPWPGASPEFRRHSCSAGLSLPGGGLRARAFAALVLRVRSRLGRLCLGRLCLGSGRCCPALPCPPRGWGLTGCPGAVRREAAGCRGAHPAPPPPGIAGGTSHSLSLGWAGLLRAVPTGQAAPASRAGEEANVHPGRAACR